MSTFMFPSLSLVLLVQQMLATIAPTGSVSMDKKICHCGVSIIQQRFCNYDFVITGRKIGESKRIFLDMSTLKHPVAVIPVTVEMVLKGPMMEHTTVNLHYLVEGFCGVDRTSLPENDETYVITGFQYKPNSVSEHKGEIPFMVTSCSDTLKLKALGLSQVAGIFYNTYCLGDFKPLTNGTCSFPLYAAKCYEKYRICLDHTKHAEWASVGGFNHMGRIPEQLHSSIRERMAAGEDEIKLFDQCFWNLKKH